jgi:hypothetical protein
MLALDRLAGALALGGLVLAASPSVRAAEPPPAAHGAVVVALGEGASPAARPLARDVYRHEALRPSIDDATARVLAGDPVPAEAPSSLRELAELRRSIPPAGTDVASRRLLASLGEELHAKLVVSVALEDGKPVARVLRVAGASFERVALSASVEPSPAGSEPSFAWPGAAAALHPLLVQPAAATPLAPVAAAAPPAPPPPAPGKPPYWKSPWFWAPLGVLLAAGVTVLVVSQTADTSVGNVHLQGHVAQ